MPNSDFTNFYYFLIIFFCLLENVIFHLKGSLLVTYHKWFENWSRLLLPLLIRFHRGSANKNEIVLCSLWNFVFDPEPDVQCSPSKKSFLMRMNREKKVDTLQKNFCFHFHEFLDHFWCIQIIQSEVSRNFIFILSGYVAPLSKLWVICSWIFHHENERSIYLSTRRFVFLRYLMMKKS